MLVYKYRDGNTNKTEGQKVSNFDRDLISIEKNYFWGSYYKDLNDPCEGLISIDRFKNQAKSLKWLIGKNRTAKFKNVNIALENLMLQLEKVGIYSLSQTYKDELLWAHYSNSHKGFCIEYDLELLSKDYIHNFTVFYNDKIPEIGIEDIAIRMNEIIRKMFGYKYKRWNYEKEYRIITNNHGINLYNFKALKSIYFGLKMDLNEKRDIMNRLKGRGIKYFQIEQLPKTYKFEAIQITDINDPEITYFKQIPSNITEDKPVNFKIVEQKYWAVGEKGNIEIELDKKVNELSLKWLASLIKSDIFNTAKLVFMFYKIKNQKDSYIAWATSHFREGKIDVVINSFIEV